MTTLTLTLTLTEPYDALQIYSFLNYEQIRHDRRRGRTTTVGPKLLYFSLNFTLNLLHPLQHQTEVVAYYPHEVWRRQRRRLLVNGTGTRIFLALVSLFSWPKRWLRAHLHNISISTGFSRT